MWTLGSADGGGLAMNDSVTVCIYTLRSVMVHLQSVGIRGSSLSDQELAETIEPFAEILGRHFARMSTEQMRQFRALRGGAGHITGTRRCQQALHDERDTFNPPELQEFLNRVKAQTNTAAYELITRMEEVLQRNVLEELKSEFAGEDNAWWFNGVPKPIRKKVDDRINEDQGKKGGRELNFDLIDYRDVIVANWNLFEPMFAADAKGNKDARTSWIAEVNEIRKTVMHASKGAHLPVTEEQLARLQELHDWLVAKVSGDLPVEMDASEFPAPV